MTHANAPLTPEGRRRLVVLIVEQGWTVQRATERLPVSSATASKGARLERAGLVRRVRCSNDERVVRVHATKAGLALEKRVAPVRTAVESSTGLTDAQFAELRSSLHRLRKQVRATER